MLSDQDILRELGEGILLAPFVRANVKGASLNLTTSRLAWRLRTKDSAFDSSKKVVVIPANETVLIETRESIHVSQRIGGTFHSRVRWVSKGLSHISTTLDPGWTGPCLLTFHNYSNEAIEVPEGDDIATIVLHYTRCESCIEVANRPGRPELLGAMKLTDEEKRWLEEPWRITVKDLRGKMSNEADFLSLKHERDTRRLMNRPWFRYVIRPASVVVGASAVVGLSILALNSLFAWGLGSDVLVPLFITGFAGIAAAVVAARVA